MQRLKESLILKDLSYIIINNAFDAIIYYLPVKDDNNTITDFEFVFMNDSSFKFLSGTREKYIGKSFLSLFPDAKKNGMFDAFKSTAETGKASEDIYFYEYDEYKGWYRDSVIKYEDGIIVYFRDVTSQKTLELEIENKNRQLEKMLKDKEILLKETHHRIKNNLQLLVSMLHLQSDHITDPDFREQIDITCQRIITISKIHQNLYENTDYTSINLNKFIREMVKSLLDIYDGDKERIKICYDIDEVNICLNYSINLGLIIHELIVNSLKHAFTGMKSGEIKILIKQQNLFLQVIFSDSGKGLPVDFRFEKSNTLGLMLVKSFAEQMGGDIKFKNQHGATFIINVPVS